MSRGGNESIAVVGIGCRLPGADGPETFWRLLQEGGDAVREVPKDRFDIDAYYDPQPGVPGKICSRFGGFLEAIDEFDASYFGISPREAGQLDPQQRILLEVVVEALEDAGQRLDHLLGRRAGVFVGVMGSEYLELVEREGAEWDVTTVAGGSRNAVAGRVAYVLGLKGPCVAVDSDRSSSLLAVHLACQSLRRGESEIAIAGGTNLILRPEPSIAFSRSGMLALDGRCKFGDVTADGFVRSEGVGVVVLKRLADAVRDMDTVYATVRGSSVNNDGQEGGDLLAPGRRSQEEMLRAACVDAGVTAGELGYVEAHGTGTLVGDQVELAALGHVLGEARAGGACAVGSVKTNIGHLEAAAGIVGLIKVALSIWREEIVGNIHLRELTPQVAFEELPLWIPTSPIPWEGRRLAGVSSFGLTGTNVHVVLEGVESAGEGVSSRGGLLSRRGPFVLPLSGRSSAGVVALARRYHKWLPETDGGLEEICHSASARRDGCVERLSVVAGSVGEMREKLHDYLDGDEVEGVSRGRKGEGAEHRLAFLFSGQGSQWIGMGRKWLERCGPVREVLEQVDRLVQVRVGWSLLEELRSGVRLDENDVMQVGIFAIQLALTRVWRELGVRPAAVLGHSMGEVAAAHASGVLSLEDAVTVITTRGALMRQTAGQGQMMVVGLGEEATRAALDGRTGVVVAATNSAAATVVSGDLEPMEALKENLSADGVRCHLVRTDVACHSHQMDPLCAPLEAGLREIRPTRSRVPMWSSVTGGLVDGEGLGAGYWVRNLREPVQFAAAAAAVMAEHDWVLEVSPHPVLMSSTLDVMSGVGEGRGACFTSMRRGKELDEFLATAGSLWVRGYPIALERLYQADGPVRLPRYPWQRRSYWYATGEGVAREEVPHRERRGASSEPQDDAVVGLAERLQGVKGAERREVLREYIRRQSNQVLGFPRGATLEIDRPFRELGLTSLMAVDLRSRLGRALERTLPATLLFKYPTIEKLAGHLAEESGGTGGLLGQILVDTGIVTQSQLGQALAEQSRGGQRERLGSVLIRMEMVTPDQLSLALMCQVAEPVAVVGMGCRFPGDVDDAESFWDLLSAGADGIDVVPRERWPWERYYDDDPDSPGKMVTKRGGFVGRVDQFDAAFFGIPPGEAEVMDPQQRLLLEVAWEALEHAGNGSVRGAAQQAGVFLGAMNYNNYAALKRRLDHPQEIGPYDSTADSTSIAAGRLSYTFGFQGPAVTVDTACSSSLVALHLACQSLRTGECTMALAGGVNLILSPEHSICFSKAGMLAPDGRSKTFDAQANGYVRGEGCGIVVLKRLSDALRNQDHVWAVVLGSAVNQDGRSSGLTAPNELAQEAVIQRALASAGVRPDEICYVEAHGTGTRLGDPIEVQAKGAVFGPKGRQRLGVGSVKTNVGHLEAAAGVAGLMKVVLALSRETIPRHLHLEAVNPHIGLEELPVVFPSEGVAWPAGYRRRLAGVSSFGYSGTNAHVVVGEAPAVAPRESAQERPLHLLALSARSEEALRELGRRYEKYLRRQAQPPLGDVCFTAGAGRTHFDHRMGVVGSTRAEAAAALAERLDGGLERVTANGLQKIAFLFTGQGAQYCKMGRELYETQPTFRGAVDSCAKILDELLPERLLDLLYGEMDAGLIDQTGYTQPALFAVEYALAELWRSFGVEPHVVMGHSVGEVVAACVAGVFSLEDGLRLISARGRLMQALPSGGKMAAVFEEEERVASRIASLSADLSIAAVNGPKNVVVSGEGECLDRVLEQLTSERVRFRPLNVSHAFHSPLMDPMLEEFARVAAEVQYSPPKVALISNVSGRLAERRSEQDRRSGQPQGYRQNQERRAGERRRHGTSLVDVCRPEYWVEHVRQAVLFERGTKALHELGTEAYLEIGPDPVLIGMAQSCVPDGASWLPSLSRRKSDWKVMLQSLSDLYVNGALIDWQGYDRGYQRRRVPLPTYPFQRKRFWAKTIPTPEPDGREDHYAVQWRSEVSEPLRDESARRWLVFADETGLADAMGELISTETGRRVLLARCGGVLDASGDRWQIAPTDREGFTQVLREAAARDDGELNLVYLWALGADSAEGQSPDALLEEVERVCAGFLHLVQAAAEIAQSVALSLWLVTRGAQAVHEEDGVASLLGPPLWGLARVVREEHPELHCRMVDVDPEGDISETATALLGECRQQTPPESVAFRRGQRMEPRLARYPMSLPEATVFHEDATYLITGGTGGIGLKVAQWMVEHGARHLLLLGRGGASPATAQVADTLQGLGAQVVVKAADVAQAGDLRRVLEEARGSLPPLRGVIHAAGVVDVTLLKQLTWDKLGPALAAKVAGSWNLHQLLEAQPLDFFVLFSSQNTLLAAQGIGSYAAANAFLDGLAHHRRSRGLAAQCINWGPWSEVGMLVESGGHWREWYDHAGFGAITPTAGLATLGAALADGAPQVAVIPADWDRFARALGPATPALVGELVPRGDGPALREKSFAEQLAGLDREEHQARMLQHVQAMVARVTGFDEPRLTDVRRSLVELGITSLMAVEIRTLLGRSIGRSLPATLVFDFPSMEDVAAYLSQLLIQGDQIADSREDAEATDTEDLSTRLDELEDLLEGLTDEDLVGE